MNCVIYARVSTEDQAELSIPAQLQAMHAFATRRDWTVVGEFIEPGVSGRSVEARVALQALLRRCKEAPQIDFLLVHKVDRLARNIRDHVNIRFSLKQHDVRLASVVENVDDSISGQLLENIMASIAQFYSGNLGEEVKKGMRMKIEKGGWPHLPPRGYKLTYAIDGKRSIEPSDEAPTIRYAFEQYATNRQSYLRLRLLLAERGFLTKRGKTIPQAGVERMLKNPFYVGRVQFNGSQFPGNHEPIVPEALFCRVQEIIASRPKNHGEKGRLRFLLRGVAYCSGCRSKMTAERHGQWSYYRCITRILTPEACSARLSNAAATEASVRALYTRLHLSPPLRDRVLARVDALLKERGANRSKHLASLKMRHTKAEEREVKLAEAFADGSMSQKAYRTAALRVRTELAGIQSSLKELDSDPARTRAKVVSILTFAESLVKLHQTVDTERQYRLVRAVFERIFVERGEVVGYELRPPLSEILRDDRAGPASDADLDNGQIPAALETFVDVDEFLSA